MPLRPTLLRAEVRQLHAKKSRSRTSSTYDGIDCVAKYIALAAFGNPSDPALTLGPVIHEPRNYA